MSRVPEVIAVLEQAGGLAERSDIVAAVSVGALRSAVDAGVVVRVGRGLYGPAPAGLPWDSGEARVRSWTRWDDGPSEAERVVLARRHALARSVRGALTLRCAAAHHGWMILREPAAVEVAVPRSRRLPRRQDMWACHRDLHRDELTDAVTAPLRTVLDAAAVLLWPESLAIADSALRAGHVGEQELVEAGRRYSGRGAAAVRRVCLAADGGAANPFESLVRSIAGDVPEVALATQVVIEEGSFEARVDLANERLRIVVEAESREFHAGAAFDDDCVRYDELVARDWLVLRVPFTAALRRPEWVAEMLRATALVRAAQGYPKRNNRLGGLDEQGSTGPRR